MNYRSFEVIARYAHGTRAVVVHATGTNAMPSAALAGGFPCELPFHFQVCAGHDELLRIAEH